MSSNNNHNKNIYWIRHAETLSNISELNYAIVDPGLTSNGYLQCEKLKEHIYTNKINIHIDLVVVSPLERTLETCSNILNLQSFKLKNIPIISLDEIREHINQPCHKRTSIDKKKSRYKLINFDKIKSNEDMIYKKFNGQEPKTNLIDRCNWFLKWLKNRKEKNIMVITHGNFLLPMFENILSNITDKTFFFNCEMRKSVLYTNDN